MENNEDRISTMPDHVLQHILSFLETVDAARTILLSKRWRDMWALDFEGSEVDYMPMTERKICIARSKHKSPTLQRLQVCGRANIERHQFSENVDEDDQFLQMKENVIKAHAKLIIGGADEVTALSPELHHDLRRGSASECCYKIPGNMSKHESPILQRLQVCGRANLEWHQFSENVDEEDQFLQIKENVRKAHAKLIIGGADEVTALSPELHHDLRRGSASECCYRIPRNISSLEHLRMLELGFCRIGDVGALKLASVGTLFLDSVSATDKALNMLISSCYNVNELRLGALTRVHRLDLSLQELWSMELFCCPELREFKIDAPKLQYVRLDISGRCLAFSMANSLDLRYANLRIGSQMRSEDQFRNLVCQFGRAKVLSLSCSFRHNLSQKNLFEKGHSCCNLKKLEVHSNACVAVSILKLFPNLEDFTFTSNMWDEGNKDQDIKDLQDFPTYCLRHSLKRIEMVNFRACNFQINVANYLAANALVLETMHLSDCEGKLATILKETDRIKTRIASPYGQLIYT